MCFYNNTGLTWTADTGHGFAWREQNDVATLEIQDNLSVSVGVSVLFTWTGSHGSYDMFGASFKTPAASTASGSAIIQAWGYG